METRNAAKLPMLSVFVFMYCVLRVDVDQKSEGKQNHMVRKQCEVTLAPSAIDLLN